VDVSQPSSVLLRLKREFAAGQLLHAGDNQTEVHLILEDGSDYPGVGSLQFTEVSVEETTGSVTLRAVFPNPDRLLLPGMFVHERLTEGQRTDALLVPQQGISRGPTGDASAMVVVDGNKIEVRKLVTGPAIGSSWLVSEGLKDGDRVVVEGLQTTKPGIVVDPKEFVALPVNEKTTAKPAQVAAQ
jgi:membrane fusion protein, multidrug efflux system